MPKPSRPLSILILSLFHACAAAAAPHWDYGETRGPGHWAELSPEFGLCAQGRNQSPVDLASPLAADLPALHIDYAAGNGEVIHNGHTIRVNLSPGASLQLDGHAFTLQQFHFHSPSENTLAGRHFPMELHLVHADAAGELAVIAVMFEEGAPNPALAPVWTQLPGRPGETRDLAAALDPASLLPADHDYYRYSGSLTTPPCTEGVRWLVLSQPLSASSGQIARLRQALGHANNRPPQPLYARQILH